MHRIFIDHFITGEWTLLVSNSSELKQIEEGARRIFFLFWWLFLHNCASASVNHFFLTYILMIFLPPVIETEEDCITTWCRTIRRKLSATGFVNIAKILVADSEWGVECNEIEEMSIFPPVEEVEKLMSLLQKNCLLTSLTLRGRLSLTDAVSFLLFVWLRLNSP